LIPKSSLRPKEFLDGFDDVRRESVGDADADGDEREAIRLEEFGTEDQMFIGDESPIPSSQSIELSFPIVFHKSINSGLIIIDFDDVEELEEHVELPVDEIICAACPN
jgi:hypothetical protein